MKKPKPDDGRITIMPIMPGKPSRKPSFGKPNPENLERMPSFGPKPTPGGKTKEELAKEAALSAMRSKVNNK